jgi:hypothetical protein
MNKTFHLQDESRHLFAKTKPFVDAEKARIASRIVSRDENGAYLGEWRRNPLCDEPANLFVRDYIGPDGRVISQEFSEAPIQPPTIKSDLTNMNPHLTLKSLKVSGNSCTLGKYIVVRTSESTYRLGEVGGAWIMSGTADEVIARAGRTSEINATALPDVSFDFNEDGVQPHVYHYEKARGANFEKVAENCAAFSHAHALLDLVHTVALGNTEFDVLEAKASELLAAYEGSKATILAELRENFGPEKKTNEAEPEGPDHHVYGLHPMREADAEDRTLPCRLVIIPIGFDGLRIAVYGEGIDDSDAIEAAFEFLKERKPDWCEPDEWEKHEEAAYVQHPTAARRRR